MVEPDSPQYDSDSAATMRVADLSRLLSPQHYPNNLPLQLTSFIGRKSEISAIKQQLWTTRLLTLTGPGGSGKTRSDRELGDCQRLHHTAQSLAFSRFSVPVCPCAICEEKTHYFLG